MAGRALLRASGRLLGKGPVPIPARTAHRHPAWPLPARLGHGSARDDIDRIIGERERYQTRRGSVNGAAGRALIPPPEPRITERHVTRRSVPPRRRGRVLSRGAGPRRADRRAIDRHAGVRGPSRAWSASGRTVFRGAAVEEFTVRVIGTLKSVVAPQRDLILAKLEGGPLAETGVIAGMSGSPVYIDGRLIGAVSYQLGQFPKEAIAGITPIAEMTDATALGGARPGLAAGGAGAGPRRRRPTSCWASGARELQPGAALCRLRRRGAGDVAAPATCRARSPPTCGRSPCRWCRAASPPACSTG